MAVSFLIVNSYSFNSKFSVIIAYNFATIHLVPLNY